MPNIGQKISNLPNKVKTKQMVALLVANDVLSTRFFFKLDKKWLRKMDKIANISVLDSSKVSSAQIDSSPTFFNIFA